jgi:hypothetical protein
VGLVAQVEETEMNTDFSLGNLKEDYLEHPSIDGRIILK